MVGFLLDQWYTLILRRLPPRVSRSSVVSRHILFLSSFLWSVSVDSQSSIHIRISKCGWINGQPCFHVAQQSCVCHRSCIGANNFTDRNEVKNRINSQTIKYIQYLPKMDKFPENGVSYLALTRSTPISWAKQNAAPLKFDRKRSEAAFCAVCRTSINADRQ